MPSGFREGDILFGNCAFGSACTGLIEGTDTAIVGNLEEPCPPPPELLKCPEDSSTKQETALLDLSSPFELARGPWRLGSLSNATSKDACAALASKVPCDEWFPALTGFFVYVPEGEMPSPHAEPRCSAQVRSGSESLVLCACGTGFPGCFHKKFPALSSQCFAARASGVRSPPESCLMAANKYCTIRGVLRLSHAVIC